jgi:hypothetical protein
MIQAYTSYDINGYTFYTRAQDNKKTNQNSGIKTDAYDYDGNRETYYRGDLGVGVQRKFEGSIANGSDSQME